MHPLFLGGGESKVEQGDGGLAIKILEWIVATFRAFLYVFQENLMLIHISN